MAHYREWQTDGRHTGVADELVLEGHEVYIRSRQDCTAIAEANRRIKNEGGVTSPGGGMSLQARIPNLHRYRLWPQEFEKRHGFKPTKDRYSFMLFEQFVSEKLKLRDNRDFAINEQQIGRQASENFSIAVSTNITAAKREARR